MARFTASETNHGRRRGSSTATDQRQYGEADSTWGSSWKSPRPRLPSSEEPPSRSIGQQFAHAVARPVIALVIAGPEVTAPTPMSRRTYE